MLKKTESWYVWELGFINVDTKATMDIRLRLTDKEHFASDSPPEEAACLARRWERYGWKYVKFHTYVDLDREREKA